MPSSHNDIAESSTLTSPRTRKDDDAHLAGLDRALQRMQKLTPPHPYILTIPQEIDKEVRLPDRYHQQGQWAWNTPFQRDEHYTVQYQTFVFHKPGGIFLQHNSELVAADPQGRDVRSKASTQNTTNSTPSVAKKKITFDAYKKKQTGGPVDKEEAQNTLGKPTQEPTRTSNCAEKIKSESQDLLKAAQELESKLDVGSGDAQEDTRLEKSLKRKREHDEHQKKPKHVPSQDAAAQSKRARDNPSLSVVKTISGTNGVMQSSNRAKVESSPHNTADTPAIPHSPLPPKLSPGLPPKLSPLRSTANYEDLPELPPRLSPTIPENLAKVLRAHAQAEKSSHLKPSTANDASHHDGHLTPLRAIDHNTKRKSPTPRNGFRANSSSPAVQSDTGERDQPRVIKPTSNPSKITSSAKETPNNIVVKSPPKRKQEAPERLVVKLKYGKARRDDVTRLLKMRPRNAARSSTEPAQSADHIARKRATDESAPANKSTSTGASKGVAQKIGPVKRENKPDQKVTPDEAGSGKAKRPLPADEQPAPAMKRQRADTLDGKKAPSTPVQLSTASSTQKHGLLATPVARKDILSANAMKRSQSQDSSVNHPSPALPDTPNVPVNGAQTSDPARPTSSSTASKTARQRQWEAEERRFLNIARELKHAASKCYDAMRTERDAHGPSSAAYKTNQKLRAVHGLESFLCFLIAYTSAELAVEAAEPKKSPNCQRWHTLVKFYNGFLKETCAAVPTISGIAAILTIVVCTRALDLNSRFPNNDGLTRDEMLKIQDMLARAAADADAKLDVDVLQTEFPGTWRARSKKAVVVEGSALEVGKLDGAYRLPIGLATSPLLACRAGLALLAEWVGKEKLDYVFSLKL